jgi:hypothetical protein
MNVAMKYRDRVDPDVMLPRVNWREPHNERGKHGVREITPRTEGSLEVVAGAGGKNNGNRGSARTARNGLKSKVGS